MRKSIMSFSPLGRRKAIAKMKTGNMEKAERAAAQVPDEPQEQTSTEGKAEKNFVQTVFVPKKQKASGTTTTSGKGKPRRNKSKRYYVNT